MSATYDYGRVEELCKRQKERREGIGDLELTITLLENLASEPDLDGERARLGLTAAVEQISAALAKLRRARS